MLAQNLLIDAIRNSPKAKLIDAVVELANKGFPTAVYHFMELAEKNKKTDEKKNDNLTWMRSIAKGWQRLALKDSSLKIDQKWTTILTENPEAQNDQQKTTVEAPTIVTSDHNEPLMDVAAIERLLAELQKGENKESNLSILKNWAQQSDNRLIIDTLLSNPSSMARRF